MSRAYYNEIDPKAAAWLRELIKHDYIAAGDVDERSIEDVTPAELAGYTQCHFFAGIGGWSLALRMAGWPDDRAVWTGSCPCQPFSEAGKGAGFADERHLWPAFEWLIGERQPPTIYGEQVAPPAGLKWLDLVSADLEGQGYTAWAADLCAASVGAPHIRQRLYWVAHRDGKRLKVRSQPHRDQEEDQQPTSHRLDVGGRGADDFDWLADGSSTGLEVIGEQQARRQRSPAQRGSQACELADDASPRCVGANGPGEAHGRTAAESGRLRDAGELAEPDGGDASPERLQRSGQHGLLTPNGWADCEWIACRDGKARPVEPGTFPLAHGVPGRVGLLRGYGNAIVPQVAATFIKATELI